MSSTPRRLPPVDRNLLGDQGQLRSPTPVTKVPLKAGLIRTCVRRHPAPLPALGARDDQHDLSQLARRAPRGATANRTEQIRAPTTFRTRPAAQLMRESSAVATLGSGGAPGRAAGPPPRRAPRHGPTTPRTTTRSLVRADRAHCRVCPVGRCASETVRGHGGHGG
jgi:hypothetical protein